MPSPKAKPKPQRRTLGTVYYSTAHNSWCAELGGKDPLTGKRRPVKRYFKGAESDFKARLEAEKALANLIAESGRGALQDPSSVTVRDWLSGARAP